MNLTSYVISQSNIDDFIRYWNQYATQINLNDDISQNLYRHLINAYSEPHRAYHTVQHIVECLDLLHSIKQELADPLAVELAIWFHDIIYQPQSTNNEKQSAILMSELCEGLLPEVQIQKVHDWIVATQHHQATHDLDLQYLLDIDLAILASSPTRFAEYEQQIRFEYAWVDAAIYQQKRAAVLQHFLDQQPIYHTPYIQQLYEESARQNLKNAIQGSTSI